MRKLILPFLATAIAVCAQTAENPISDSIRTQYAGVKKYILGSAEKMSEENYAFKPAPDVRSFGQLIGHVADANLMMCGIVLGGERPAGGIEKSKTTKADLVKAVTESFNYCDKAYDAMTDASLTQKVKFRDNERPKYGVLTGNIMHDVEHYGNMITYLRLKGLVPPSSERR